MLIYMILIMESRLGYGYAEEGGRECEVGAWAIFAALGPALQGCTAKEFVQ